MQSTSSSTRTFQSSAATADKPAKTARRLSARRVVTRKNAPRIAIISLLLVSGFLLLQYRSAQNKLHSSSQQVGELVARVGKVAVLPGNETPTVATVTNAEKLRGQTFFANAKDGDKVLVFNKAKQAILYRPSTGQIVTIAPVNASAGSGVNAPSQ